MAVISKLKLVDELTGAEEIYDISDAQSQVDISELRTELNGVITGKVDKAGDHMTGTLYVDAGVAVDLVLGDQESSLNLNGNAGGVGRAQIGASGDLSIVADDIAISADGDVECDTVITAPGFTGTDGTKTIAMGVANSKAGITTDNAMYLVGSQIIVAEPDEDPALIRNVKTPSADSDAATKKYVDDTAEAEATAAAAGKVDTVDNTITDPVAYIALGDSGGNGTRRISTEVISNTIAQRENGGRLKVGEPTGTSHAATKNYVDTNIASALSNVNEFRALTTGELTTANGYTIIFSKKQEFTTDITDVKCVHYVIGFVRTGTATDDTVIVSYSNTPYAIYNYSGIGDVAGWGTASFISTLLASTGLTPIKVDTNGVTVNGAKDVASNSGAIIDFYVFVRES